MRSAAARARPPTPHTPAPHSHFTPRAPSFAPPAAIWATGTGAECAALVANTQLMRDYRHRGDREWVKESVFALSRSRGTYCPSTRDVSMSLPLKRLDRG